MREEKIPRALIKILDLPNDVKSFSCKFSRSKQLLTVRYRSKSQLDPKKSVSMRYTIDFKKYSSEQDSQ